MGVFACLGSLGLGGASIAWCQNDNSAPQGASSAPKSQLQRGKEDRLLGWHGGLGIREEKLNRGDIEDLDPSRHVVAVVGITGGGKSSTANTLMFKYGGRAKKKDKKSIALSNNNVRRGNRNRKFKEASSLTSVTRSLSFRDYEHSGVPFRVIDTPGLADTNRESWDVESEMVQFKRLARSVVL